MPPARGPLPATLPANLIANALGGFAVMGGAIAMILGALVAGSEYDWGSRKTALTQRPGRLTIFGGMVAALATALLAVVLVHLRSRRGCQCHDRINRVTADRVAEHS